MLASDRLERNTQDRSLGEKKKKTTSLAQMPTCCTAVQLYNSTYFVQITIHFLFIPKNGDTAFLNMCGRITNTKKKKWSPLLTIANSHIHPPLINPPLSTVGWFVKTDFCCFWEPAYIPKKFEIRNSKQKNISNQKKGLLVLQF